MEVSELKIQKSEQREKNKLLRRIVENAEMFQEYELLNLNVEELRLFQKKLFIDLMIKQQFRSRRNRNELEKRKVICN